MRKIVFLDAETLGNVEGMELFSQFGEFIAYDYTPANQIVERIAGAEIIITNSTCITREIMEASPELRLICIAATGMNIIDLEAAKERNIAVKNVAGYSTNSVTQVTFAMVLELVQHTRLYNDFSREGYINAQCYRHKMPAFNEIAGKRWGIIGLGNIGRNVAKVAEAFGAEVVYYSTTGKNNNPDFKRVEFDELMSSCDIISIHAPINDQTRNLVDARALLLMKQSAIIINLGRGGIINEAALAEALDNEAIAGAGVDVFTQEPIVAENPLLSVKHPERLVLAPHIGWTSVEARNKIVVMIADNIKNFLN